MNECVVDHQRPVVDACNSAFYLHVDDGLIISNTGTKADSIMNATADGLEEIGFSVKERVRSCDIEKTVGYEIVKQLPGLRFPARKGMLLAKSMLWIETKIEYQ